MSTTKDKQIAQLSAQVAALTALVAQTIEQQQAPAAKGKAKKAATTPRAGSAWCAFSGALSRRVTALIKEGYAEDERWAENGAENGCKRAGFHFRIASLIKREYDLDDGEGGYLDPEDEQIIGAIEHLLDNPFETTPNSEARGGMSVSQLKAAGMKIAKPSAAKPVAKPVAKPAPVKKAAPAPEPESESEAEDEAEEEPAPAPKPAAAKKSPKAATKAAPKSAVLAAAAEVAEEVKEAEAPASALEEPTEDDLKEAGLVKFKNPNSKIWYLRTVEEPKRCYLGGPEKENIAKAWANFKAGICAGIWTKNEKGKLDICPVEGSA
jgi:hypothetical protein